MKASASYPATLSFIFKACPHKDPVKAGSIGIGCAIDKKVTAIVSQNKRTQIFVNGQPISFPTVLSIVKALTDKPLLIKIKSDLPLGFGFGISAASTLSTACAINKLLKLNKTKEELAEIAHIAEITNKTGLGSVATAVTGGFLLKSKPGLPTVAVRFPFVGKKLYATVVKGLATPKILKNAKRLSFINQAAQEALEKTKHSDNLTLAEVLDLSLDFAKKSGLLENKTAASLIARIKKAGGHATISMLGQVVISDRPVENDNRYRQETLIITDRTNMSICHCEARRSTSRGNLGRDCFAPLAMISKYSQ